MFKQPARLASMLALSACAARMAGAPPDRSTHFEWLRKQEIVHHTLYGSLARGATDSSQESFEPVARPVHPKSNRLGIDLEYFPLTFWGLNGGRYASRSASAPTPGPTPKPRSPS